MRSTLYRYILLLPLVTSRELFVMATHSKCGPGHPLYDYVKIYLCHSPRDYNILLIQKLCATTEIYHLLLDEEKSPSECERVCLRTRARARLPLLACLSFCEFDYSRANKMCQCCWLLAAADIVCIASKSSVAARTPSSAQAKWVNGSVWLTTSL